MQNENNPSVVEISEVRSGLGCELCYHRKARWIKRKEYPWGIRLCDTCLELISQQKSDRYKEAYEKQVS